jgi:hypothetical protein
MNSLQQNSLNFNNKLSFDFGGGNLSSDSGLLLVRSFMEKLKLRPMLENLFNDSSRRIHEISSVIEQLIFQNIAGYHKDDAADDLRHDHIFTSILDKEALASQPTISRVMNSFKNHDVEKFNAVLEYIYKLTNVVEEKKYIILDLDSTNVQTYGNQEESEYIYHYSLNGYHPLVLYDGLTGDLMKFQLRKGSIYTSTGVKEFLEPVIKSLKKTYPEATILVRGDSGFAVPDLYELCNYYEIEYLIKLKANATLHKLASFNMNLFMESYKTDYSIYHVYFDEFFYQAKSWAEERRVICKVERAAGELIPRTSFVVTSLEASGMDVFKAYNKRGNMENFIKETKLDYGMENLSHSTFSANQAKAMILAIAYNIINAMKRLAMPDKYKSKRMLTIRSMFIKVAGRFISHSNKFIFRLSTSFPYKKTFLEILTRIDQLALG